MERRGLRVGIAGEARGDSGRGERGQRAGRERIAGEARGDSGRGEREARLVVSARLGALSASKGRGGASTSRVGEELRREEEGKGSDANGEDVM